MPTDIADRFPIAADSPPPTEVQRVTSKYLRDAAVDLAGLITDLTESGYWQSLALTRLEEALMWANKALFNQK